ACRPGHDGLGALGRDADHEQGLPKARAVLLNAAGVGQDDVRPAHEVSERGVRHGFEESHVAQSVDGRKDRLANARVAVDWEDNLDVRLAARDVRQRPPDALHRRAPRFAPVRGYQHDTLAVQASEDVVAVAEGMLYRPEQSVDDRVAGDDDP